MSDSRTEIINIIKEEFGYVNPSDYTSVDFAVRYFESRTCNSCKKKQSCEAYASAWNQYRVEYDEFYCSLWESKDGI